MKSFSVLGSIYNAKQLEAKVKAIKLRLMGFVTITKGDSDFDFMHDLYDRFYPWSEWDMPHPLEVVDLIAKDNPNTRFPGKSPTFFWIVADGSERNWNPADCWRPKSSKDEAKAAFRMAIQSQCRNKLDSVCQSIRYELPNCPITGELFDPRIKGQGEVHHDDPKFSIILSDFLEMTGIDLASVAVIRDNATLLADKALETMFQDYHEMRANLVVVSKKGHEMKTYNRVPL